MSKQYFVVCVDSDTKFLEQIKNDMDSVFNDIFRVFVFNNIQDAIFISNNLTTSGLELLLFCIGGEVLEENKVQFELFYKSHMETNYILFNENNHFETLKYFINNYSIYKIFEKNYSSVEFERALLEAIAHYENNKISKTYQKLIENTLHNRMRDLRETNAKLDHLANTDYLTGLCNRRSLFDLLKNIFYTAKRDNNTFGLLIFDIDNFKNINDTFGHDVGDEVIKFIASIANAQVRQSDIVARYGGEEFVIVLQKISTDALESFAQKLLNLIWENSKYKFSNISNITVSMGVTLSSQSDENIDFIIKRADEAMYLAKNNGKNQIQSMYANQTSNQL